MSADLYRSTRRVRALRWTGDNLDAIVAFLGPDIEQPPRRRPNAVHIGDGRMAERGDWVVEEFPDLPPFARFEAMTNTTFTHEFDPAPS